MGAAPGRPADACPYPRPFPADFDGCRAYHPAWFTPMTSGFDTMTAVWTCSNLVPAAVPRAAARFYGRCRIGDAAARAAWAGTALARRLAGLRGLSEELTQATAGLTAELMAAKGAQLQTRRQSADRDAATARLRALSRRWFDQLDRFLDHHAAALRALDFPPEAIRVLCEDLMETWITQEHSGTPEVSDAALQLFPDDVRTLLRQWSEPPSARADAQ